MFEISTSASFEASHYIEAEAGAAHYRDNAMRAKAAIAALTTEIAAAVTPLADRPVVVFHDAYQYFERRFGLKVVGSITVSPDIPPSAKRLSELRRRIASLGAACVFAEPQFEPALVRTVTEGTKARAGVLGKKDAGEEPKEKLE